MTRIRPFPPLLAATLLLAGLTGSAAAEDPAGLEAPPDPVDPRSWVLPEDMTWDDYRPIPGYDWNDPAVQPPKKLRAALVLADFQDRDFVITEPEGSDLAGNPQEIGGYDRRHVARFYNDFLMTEPMPLNNYHTVNEYWLENSYGLLGVDSDGFGPYRMDGKEHEYGLGGGDAGGGGGSCPAGDTCGRNFDNELLEKSLEDVTLGIARNGGRDYDFRFLLHAGYDESGTWQEFGEMRFQDREDVTDEFGNPDPTKPNWAPTRYVPWTSFWSAKGIWSHALPGALSTQGESDGASTYAHEFSHILGVLDNYNNPYGNPVRRSYSGPWDMLSRGTFNGPGGPHNRWQIPPTLGGTMGSHHMLRNKIRLGFTRPGEILPLERSALSLTGPVIADVWAREIPLGPGTGRTGLRGLQIALTDGDKTPSCMVSQDWRCDGGGYHNYTLEVVDRMGYDSFTPDHGVLIAKTKAADTAPFIWVTDAHSEDFNRVDFIRPNGEPAMISKGDYRQLADALFHAGTGEGVVSELVDAPNRLHFYVLETNRDDEGVLSYRVAVRSLDGGGPFTRGVTVAAPAGEPASPGRVAVYTFPVTNTGQATDLVRVAATTDAGWVTAVEHTVVEVQAGETVQVPVYVSLPSVEEGEELPSTLLSFSATSETDDSQSGSESVEVVPVQ